MTPLWKSIETNARAFSGKPALICGRKSLSYAELWRGVMAAAARLAGLGVGVGDRVVLSAANSISFPALYYATHAVGAVAVPIDPRTAPGRTALIAEKTIPVLVIHPEPGLFPGKQAFTPDDFAGESVPERDVVLRGANPDAPADILFTSGTTGQPKGVVLSSDNIRAAVENITRFVGNGAYDVEMSPLPVCHSFGLGRMRCVLDRGGTLILEDGFARVGRIYSAMREHGATGISFVPAGWAVLQKVGGDTLGEFAERLRYIEIGSAHMPIEDKRALMRLLPKTRICMHYGLTEASRAAFIEFHADANRLDSIGRESPLMRVRVADADSRPCPAGVEGEIQVAGDAVMSGYWRDPEATAASFTEDGYFRTGDHGLMNGSGDFILMGRRGDLINVGGRKVAPQEVEELILEVPGVRDCACVPVPDREGVMGERVGACCVTGMDVETLRKKIMRRLGVRGLENYKIPAVFFVVESLPRTASGKLQRQLLEQHARRVLFPTGGQ